EGVIEYEPILFNVKLNEKKNIRIINVTNWQISDHTLQTAEHFITYKCDCGTSVNAKYDLSLFTENPKGEFVCIKCKAHYEFKEKDFFSFIKNSFKQLNHNNPSQEISKIIFLTRDSHVIGGGNLIITKYINWLAELGYNVDLISFGLKPEWVNLNANFKSISTIEDLRLPEEDNFVVIAGSIWEIPELLQRVNSSNVFLFCQGYEGYHYGKDFLSATSDKSFFDQMHSLPFQVIGVSTHLVELFSSKFNKESYYIPNSINHSIFKQTIEYSEKSNSIVFIGNPMHPLKGFNYLLQSVQNLANSKFLTEKIKLIVITGSDVNLRKVREVLDSSGIDDFELHTRLSRSEVAEKINKSKLLVCASWYEGFSLPVLEAMNCGTPVITTANQGAESFCINEYNSLIVNFGDINSLVQRIVAVFTNRINLEQLIENAKNTAAFFTESTSFKSFVNSFSKITNKKLDAKTVVELENKLLNNENSTGQNSTIMQNTIKNEQEENFLFSIIIPTYNRPKSLKKALTSISEQIFKNFEVVVINDAGDDVTNILAEFNNTFSYKLITNETNKERSASRNEGISIAVGKYILFLDDDDIFYPSHLKTLADNISDKFPVIYTDANRAVYYSANGKQILNTKFVPYSMEFSRKKLLIGNISPINCFCIERELLTEVGLFTGFINVLEDWELLLRLSQKTKFKHIRKTTCEVSWHSENTTSQKAKEFETIRNWIYKRNAKEIEKVSKKEKTKIINEFNEIWKKDELYNSPLISIVIPVYNKIEYTKQCLESIEKFTKSNYEIIIIDNNSEDETVKTLNKEYPNTKIISNIENLGFPKAVNQGILEAKGEYIIIANNDIVFTENWINRMLEIAKQHPDVGIVGPISNSV
ncbi:MAG: glycosyltransferase, partial [Flavobacteriaceae bacterium]|nr:glycosyltransferase [Flavobacteriaceae bacterium]